MDFSWVNGFDGLSPIIGVRVEAFTVNQILRRDVSGDATLQSITVSDLQPFFEYEFRLYVRNAIGLSAPVVTFARTLSQSK